jgi:hypothetical protein
MLGRYEALGFHPGRTSPCRRVKCQKQFAAANGCFKLAAYVPFKVKITEINPDIEPMTPQNGIKRARCGLILPTVTQENH